MRMMTRRLSIQHSEDDGTRGKMNASSLKQKKKLQEEVKARMSELQLLDEDSSSDSSNSEEQTKRKSKPKRSNKSGRNKTAEDVVAKEIDWPHYHVYRGSNRRAARYQDLSVEEFTFGYLSSVLYGSESDQTKQKMLSHLHELMRDATEYPWENVLNFHGILLHQHEMERISWDNTADIQKMRDMYVTKAPSASDKTHAARPTQPIGTSGPPFCLSYQRGKCNKYGDHQTQRRYVQHICAFCFTQQKGYFQHPEKDCRRKQRSTTTTSGDAPKNE